MSHNRDCILVVARDFNSVGCLMQFSPSLLVVSPALDVLEFEFA